MIVETVAYFEIYYKRILGITIPSVRMYSYVKVVIILLRFLQEVKGETEEREVRATCDRISFDEDPNIRYNCSFNVDENVEIAKVTMDPSVLPTF